MGTEISGLEWFVGMWLPAIVLLGDLAALRKRRKRE